MSSRTDGREILPLSPDRVYYTKREDMVKREDIVPGVAYFIPLAALRQTPKVNFHALPHDLVKEIAAIDRVEHDVGAYSPIAKDRPELRAWYMHPHQEDNLLVLRGKRDIDLYTIKHGVVERFQATPHAIQHNGKTVFEGPALLGWGTHVFHRVTSPDGSVSMNFARHFDGFNIKDNFNIYELNTETGEYTTVREGHLDQPVQDMGE